MQDAKLFYLLPDMNHFFWTRLTFSSTTSILFAFSSALLTLPSLFSLFSQHGLTLPLHFC
jgi:hypothetical protein